jgi:enamine deaminase RidA (YjgF/YER057c/UK114 family)
VLDCPAFSKRLEITSSNILYDEEDISVGNLCITGLQLIDKETGAITPFDLSTNNDSDLQLQSQRSCFVPSVVASLDAHMACDYQFPPVNITIGNDGYVHIPLLVPSRLGPINSPTADTVVEQIRYLLQYLQHIAASAFGESPATLHDVVFVRLYLSDLQYFEAVNAEYCKYFDEKYPHSRCCVQVQRFDPIACIHVIGCFDTQMMLPEGVHVALAASMLLRSGSSVAVSAIFASRTRQVDVCEFGS